MGSCRKLSANFYSTKIRVAKQRTEACGEGERKPPWSCSTPTCNTKLNHGRCAFFFSFPSVFLAIRPKRTAMVPRDQNLPKMIREPAKSSTYCLLSVLLLLSQESDCGCERLQLQATTSLLVDPSQNFGLELSFLLFLFGFRVVQGEHFCETFFG